MKEIQMALFGVRLKIKTQKHKRIRLCWRTRSHIITRTLPSICRRYTTDLDINISLSQIPNTFPSDVFITELKPESNNAISSWFYKNISRHITEFFGVPILLHELFISNELFDMREQILREIRWTPPKFLMIDVRRRANYTRCARS